MIFQKWHQIICYRKYVWSYHFKMVYIFFNKQFKTQHQNKNKDDLQWKIWMGFGGYLAVILRLFGMWCIFWIWLLTMYLYLLKYLLRIKQLGDLKGCVTVDLIRKLSRVLKSEMKFLETWTLVLQCSMIEVQLRSACTTR